MAEQVEKPKAPDKKRSPVALTLVTKSDCGDGSCGCGCGIPVTRG